MQVIYYTYSVVPKRLRMQQQHLKPKCVNVQTPMGWLWLLPSGGLIDACLHTHANAHTHAGRNMRNNGSITRLKCEWLCYLAITLNLPWNSVFRNWVFVVRKEAMAINLLWHQGLWSVWNFTLKCSTEKRNGFLTFADFIFKCLGPTDNGLVPTEKF